MANDFSTRTLYIDTAMAAPGPFERLKISTITWTKQAAAGDALEIVDKNGKVIVSSVAQSADSYQYWPIKTWLDNFQVTVLGSGVVQIYIQ